MLTYKSLRQNANRNISVFLLIISIITCHTYVSAEIRENTAEEYRSLGYQQHKQGNLNSAIAYYSKALAFDEANEVILNDIGVLYEQIGLQEKAEKHYLQAININKNYLPAYTNLAYLYKRLGWEKKAFHYFKIRFEKGSPDDPWAKKVKDEIIAINPSYEKWFVHREAEKLNLELVRKKKEEFYKRVELSKEHYQKGEMYFKDGNFNKAISEYDRALGFTPRNPVILEAKEQASLELTKTNVVHFTNQAIKRLDSGDTRSAKSEIQKMLSTIPNEPVNNPKKF